ncbi:MAG: hypothetical protein C4533_05140 [Candidatus Omnitrophota bacterium]|nr:MAG: hypothetical protein C4533_05140 [Candidatus Omnitrophota bacterium]
MEIIEALIKKENHSKEEFDTLVVQVNSHYTRQLKNTVVPQHCGLCSIFRFCKIINHKLICPWT